MIDDYITENVKWFRMKRIHGQSLVIIHDTFFLNDTKESHLYFLCFKMPSYEMLPLIWNRHGHSMLANLKIIYQLHAHPVHLNSVEIFWAEIYWGRLFLGSNIVSFNRTLVVPYEISKVNFHAEKKFLSVCQEI
jgi:hypothetical protein